MIHKMYEVKNLINIVKIIKNIYNSFAINTLLK